MEIFSATSTKHGFSLDPRTKLLLLVITSIFVMGGAGGNTTTMIVFRHTLSLIAILLLLCNRQYAFVSFSIIMYIICYNLQLILLPMTTGFTNYLILILSGTFTRFIPTILMAQYLLSTTTLSEFVASLQKIHLSEKLIIPMSVIFRFTPTVIEEVQHIAKAMRMRGIRLGGGKITKMVEYRLIPMLTCSAIIGEELSAAALTRGLGAPIKRTNICELGFQIQDIIIIMFCLFIILFQCLRLFRFIL